MKTNTIGNMFLKIRDVLVSNSPTILTGLGVTGLFSTVIFAVKATPKAIALLDEEVERRALEWSDRSSEDIKIELTTKEIVKLTWKCYIPTAIMGATTIACIIGANHINIRKNAALMSLYALTDTALQEYKEKVAETIGTRKAEKIQDEIIQENLNKHPVTKIITTGEGNTLCFDTLSGRYFYSSIEKISKIINEYNYNLLNERYMTLNEFYDYLNLEHTTLGNDIGWSTEIGMVDIYYSSKISPNNMPCVVLNYRIIPRKL